MFQLPLTASKASGNLPEGMSATQLTKQHGDKLTPAAKSFGMTFRMGFFHQLLKLDSRKQLQELTEYATRIVHRRPSFMCDGISW
jgi:hypothetical protein